METYGRFLFEFLNQFFSGFKEIFSGLISGIQKIFNIGGYTEIIQYYKNDFSIRIGFFVKKIGDNTLLPILLSGHLSFSHFN